MKLMAAYTGNLLYASPGCDVPDLGTPVYSVGCLLHHVAEVPRDRPDGRPARAPRHRPASPKQAVV
ncbi:hypothetical protein ACRAWF_38390 [Streptomyces sp. L7]